ncbi:hypothetical protein EBR96_04525 [bacterium]|nr:hypothetical protein [bacterium]
MGKRRRSSLKNQLLLPFVTIALTMGLAATLAVIQLIDAHLHDQIDIALKSKSTWIQYSVEHNTVRTLNELLELVQGTDTTAFTGDPIHSALLSISQSEEVTLISDPSGLISKSTLSEINSKTDFITLQSGKIRYYAYLRSVPLAPDLYALYYTPTAYFESEKIRLVLTTIGIVIVANLIVLGICYQPPRIFFAFGH